MKRNQARPHSVTLRSSLVSGLLAAGLLAGCSKGPAPDLTKWLPKIEHVILISLDTLRSDHCSLYGYERPTTPFLEELAERAVVFENHMVSANNTLMSHASIMTGLFPLAHDAYDKGERKQRLAPPFRTAAEIFKGAGYRTSSFATNKTWLGSEFGVMQGFEQVEAEWEDNIKCWTRYLEWFDQTQPERSFTFLHFFDPHSESDDQDGILPYDSTDELIAQFAPPRPADFTGCMRDDPTRCTSNYLNAINAGSEPLPPEHLEYLIGLYDAGIRKMDDDLRVLFDQLDQRGLLESTLFVITSDHGEEFMEHGKLLHGGISDAIMHVPLMFVFPKGFPVTGRRISEVTRSVDIAPTLLDLAGLQKVGLGTSLAPTLLGGPPPTEGEAFFGPAILRARDEHGLFKILADPNKPRFFDLDQDPHEQRNLALDPEFVASERYQRAFDRVQELRRVSTKVRVNLKKGEDFQPTFEDDEAAQEAARQLENLGYIDLGDDEDDE